MNVCNIDLWMNGCWELYFLFHSIIHSRTHSSEADVSPCSFSTTDRKPCRFIHHPLDIDGRTAGFLHIHCRQKSRGCSHDGQRLKSPAGRIGAAPQRSNSHIGGWIYPTSHRASLSVNLRSGCFFFNISACRDVWPAAH